MINLPKSRQSEVVVQELENEILIYDLKINKAYCLNETSALVWQLSDGTNHVSEIRHILTKKLKMPVSEELVWLALDQLKKDNLLENGDALEINFSGLNRRQIIKKVGLASLVTLPVISSLFAPTATMAASGCVNPGGAAAGTPLGGAGGTGMCSTPGIANATCTAVRGNLCCSGMATADACFDSGPGPNFGTFSVACRCA
jgi:hypothetical protein